MKINFLDVEEMGETREISKIPALEKDQHQVDFDKFGEIITFSRRDIVSDLLKVYLKFSAECNLMSNKGGETVDAKLAHNYEEISFGEKDLHPRFIGYAFFSMASNIVGNWEDRYLTICKQLSDDIKQGNEENNSEEPIPEKNLFVQLSEQPTITESEPPSCNLNEYQDV